MNLRKYFTVVIVFTLVLIGYSFAKDTKQIGEALQKIDELKNPTFEQIKEIYYEHWNSFEGINDPGKKKPAGWKQYKRWEHFWETRLMPDGTIPKGTDVLNEWESYLATVKTKSEKVQSNTWQLLGPVNVPAKYNKTRKQGLGRVNVVRFDPQNANVVWAGTATGGVWRSSDMGQTWTGFPFTSFLSQGVSDIAVYPKSPGVIYVATGDDNGTYGTGDNFYSVGLIKSYYGGLIWETTNLSKQLHEKFVISRVLVHPDNYNIVIVGTSAGILKSTDGGKTWESKLQNYYIKDMEFMPDDPNIINASSFSNVGQASFLRSTDNGNTWELIQAVTGASRIAITVSGSNPNKIWAIASRAGYTSFHSFHISTDRGQSWVRMLDYTVSPNILGRYDGMGDDELEGQGNYDLCIAVHPTNENIIYIGGINVWKSEDGGNEFDRITSWVDDSKITPFLHADIHDLAFKPSTTALFSANDGGLYYTEDLGKSWNDITDGMSITQYYRIGQSKMNENLIIGGCQDNGTNMHNDTGWVHLQAGDGMECAIHPADDRKMFMTYYYGSLYYSTNSGNTFWESLSASNMGESAGWITPFVIDGTNPNVMYIGFQNIYKSSEGGNSSSWKKVGNFNNIVFRSMAIAPNNSNVVYAATNYNLYMSTDAGNSWIEKYYSPRIMTYLAVDPNKSDRVWITLGDFSDGYKVLELNDTIVINISGNLPNVPVNCIVCQKNSPDRLYIGTDIGVFYTDYNSAYWEPYGEGMPNVIINELEIFYPTKKIRAATYGRGIWEAPILDCNIAQPNVTVIGETNLCSGDTVILEAEEGYSRYEWSNGDTSRIIYITSTGSYSVRVFSDEGCFANSKAVNVNFKSVPDMKILGYPGSPGYCKNDSVRVTASLGFSVYEWSNGLTGRTIYISTPGLCWVKGIASNGCEKTSDEIYFSELDDPPAPTIDQNGNLLSANSGEVVVSAYKWFLNDSLIKGATKKEYLIKEDGLYKVEITDINGCKAISENISFIVGIEDYSSADIFNIYPNPSEGDFNIVISYDEVTNAEIRVANIFGTNILNMNLKCNPGSENIFKLNINNHPVGIYIIELKIGQKRIFSKLIKN
ncbi:MAG: T9SS type A sorting domain-containing protein [bacterium]